MPLNRECRIIISTKNAISLNIAENIRNGFVDMQSKKDRKRNRPKRDFFSVNAEMLYFDPQHVKTNSADISCCQTTFN